MVAPSSCPADQPSIAGKFLAVQIVRQIKTAQALRSEAETQEWTGRNETAEMLRELADDRTETALRGLTHWPRN
ncbi:hypothetical protein [Paracoccus sp. N5]|uniref:hypothetical protein n=1 Tax=Paracoccus sp. N5 TaxID=1101189 RepID=UPI0012FC44F9|nr:hypothetical protein [Paracoccus sp. N5]